jgi:hypothetical protein
MSGRGHPICTSCGGSCARGSQGCARSPVLCASCCRRTGGCSRHHLPGSAGAPSPSSTPTAPSAPHEDSQAASAHASVGQAPQPPTTRQRSSLSPTSSLPVIDLTGSSNVSLSQTTATPAGPAPPAPQLIAFTADQLDALIRGLQQSIRPLAPATSTPVPSTPTASRSHLDTYPTPPGGTSTRPSFDLARSPEVSNTSHTSVVGSGDHSPITIQTTSAGASATNRPSPGPTSLPTRRSDLFRGSPAALRPIDPRASDKPPSSTAAVEALLYAWYDGECAGSTLTHEETAAIELYIRATLAHLKVTDHRHVLDYHRMCIAASAKGLYDPLSGGDTYPLAYSRHIGPNLFSAKGNSRPPRAWQSKGANATKRKAATAQAPESSTRCDLPGHANHTIAECYSRHPELRKPKQSATPAPAKKRKASDDKEDD